MQARSGPWRRAVAGTRTPSTTTTRRPAVTRTSTGGVPAAGAASSRSGTARTVGESRRKVRGQTKTEVRDKLRDLHTDIETGLRKPKAATIRARRSRSSQATDGRGLPRSWGARLESVLGATPQEFESPILRHVDLLKLR